MGHSPLPKLELTIAALAGRGEHKLKSVHVNVKKKDSRTKWRMIPKESFCG
jgi:hypothetical protein